MVDDKTFSFADESEVSPEPQSIGQPPPDESQLAAPLIGSDSFSTCCEFQQQRQQHRRSSQEEVLQMEEADSSFPSLSPNSEHNTTNETKPNRQSSSPPVCEVILSRKDDDENDTFFEDRSLEQRLHHVLNERNPLSKTINYADISYDKKAEELSTSRESILLKLKNENTAIKGACRHFKHQVESSSFILEKEVARLSQAVKVLTVGNQHLHWEQQQDGPDSSYQQSDVNTSSSNKQGKEEEHSSVSRIIASEQYATNANKHNNDDEDVASRDLVMTVSEEEVEDLAAEVRHSIQAEQKIQKHLSHELDQTKSQLENEKIALHETRENMMTLEKENTEAKERIQQLNDELELFKQKAKDLDKSLVLELSRSIKSKQEADEQHAILSNELNQVKGQLDKEVKALKEMAERKMSLDKENSEAKERIQSLSDGVESSQIKILDLSESNDKLRAELDKSMEENQCKQNTIMSLQDSLEQQKERAAMSKTEHADVTKKMDDLESCVDALKVENDFLLEKNESLQIDLEEANEKVTNLLKEKSKEQLITLNQSKDYSAAPSPISERLNRIRLGAERAALLKDHQKEIAKLITDRDAEMKRLSTLLDNERREREEINSDLTSRIKNEKQQLQSGFERRVQELQTKHEMEVTKMQEEAKRKAAAAAESVEIAMAQVASIEKKNKREIGKREELESTLIKVNERHQSEKKVLIQQHRNEMESLRDSWEREKQTSNELIEQSLAQVTSPPSSPKTVTRGPTSFSELNKSLCETEAFVQGIFKKR